MTNEKVETRISSVLQRSSDATGSRNITDHRIFNEIKYSTAFPVRFSLGPFRSIFYAFRSYSEKLISCWAQKIFSSIKYLLQKL